MKRGASALVIAATAAMLLSTSDSPAQFQLQEFSGTIDLAAPGTTFPVLKIYGGLADERLGSNQHAAAFGDFNGDGYDDLLVGAYRYRPSGVDPNNAPGAAYIIYGEAGRANRTIDLSQGVGANGETLIKGDYEASANGSGGILGSAVAAGDLDGDGYDDAIIAQIGAALDQRPQMGEVIIIWGSSDKPGTPAGSGSVLDLETDGTPWRIRGRSYWQIGFSLAADDINSDGFDDLVIGAPYAFNDSNVQTGAIVIRPGDSSRPTQWLDLNNDIGLMGEIRYFGQEDGGKFGWAIDIGKANDDGFNDIIVGVPHFSNQRGKVEVLYGGSFNNTFARGTITGDDDGDQYGFSVAAPKLFAGVADNILATAPFAKLRPSPGGSETTTGAGETYYLLGMIEDSYTFDQNGGILPGEILYAGTEQDAFSGWAVGGSDLNGDGFDDLIITDNASDPLGRTDAGSAWIISGWDQGGPGDKTGQRIPLDSNTKALRIYGEKPNDFFGKSVASGDFNNDGAGDLVITSVWADNPSLQPADNNAGAAYIIYGARNSNLGSNRIEKLNVSTAADPRIKTLGDFGPTLRLKVEYPTDQPESVHIVSYGASMFSIVPDKSASPVWSLNEQGLPENIPCRVTVKYTENQALSLLESRFQLYHNSGSRGTVLAQDQQVDTRRNTITGTISGFRGDLQIGYSEAVTLSAITLRDADGAFGVEDEFTNARTVTVRLGTIGFGPPQTIELAENPEFTNLTSINYEGEDEVSYQLSDTGDGVRTVYARARKNGTTSNVVSDSIKLDTVPPAAMLTADRVTNGGTLGSAGKVVFTASFSDANTFGGFNPTDDRYIRLENATLGAGSGDTFEVTPSGQEVRVVVQLLEGAARDHAGNLSAPSAEFAFDYNVLGPSPVPGGELRYVSGSTALNNVNAVFEVTFSEPIQSIDIGQLRPGLHPTAVSLSASTVDRSNLTLTTEQSVDNAAGPYRIRVQGTVPAGGDLVVQFRRNTIFDFDSNGLDPTGIEGRVELGKPQPVQASGWIFN